MKKIFYLIAGLLTLGAGIQTAQASSHREAPLIANDPLADNTDVYAFRSPDDTNKITLIACYVPFQLPQGGPNYYSFGENIRYEVHVKNSMSTSGDNITYRFTFHRTNQDPSTFFNIRLGKQNLKTTYTCERSTDGGSTWTTIISNGVVPPTNIGPRSIESGAGLGTDYGTLWKNSVATASSGEKIFCGPSDDPFFVDLGGVFDLGDLPRQSGRSRDGLKYMNVSTIAIQVDISTLQKNGHGISSAANILDPNYVIGVWASASRPVMRTLSSGAESYAGSWVQVSRLGMPLTNEAVIPVGYKDKWNSMTPYQDLDSIAIFGKFFYQPELALYMDDSLYGGAVPAMKHLRIQRSSLQSFGFGNKQKGLWSLKGTSAVHGTALDDSIFGTLLLPDSMSPRAVDIWPIFNTGVPNLAPYQLATGKGGNPLAAGKPFINNFLPTGGDMLRLNMAVPVTPRNSSKFSSLGIIAAAVAGLTDTNYNKNTSLQAIPNMDGFPNGRRLEDDVTRIELQAVSGVALAAIGLWYDDYTAGHPNPVTTDLVNVLTYSTGINNNDTTFRSTFPYVQTPWRGTGKGGGQVAYSYTQPALLPPTWSGNNCANAPSAGNITPATAVVCSGSSKTFTLNAFTADSIQWQYNTGSSTGGTWNNFGMNKDTATLSGITGTTYVRAVVHNSGCYDVSTSDAILTADAAVQITSTSATSTSVTVNYTAVQGATAYTIMVGSNTYSTSALSYTATGLSAGTTYSVCVKPNSSTCADTAQACTSVTTPCTALTLSGAQPSATKLVYSWSSGVGPYKLFYAPMGSAFTSVSVTGTMDTIKVKGSTTYVAYVVDMGSTCTPKAASAYYYYNTSGSSCGSTSPVISTSSTSVDFTVSWGSTGASSYQVYYARPGSSSWKSYSTSGTSLTINTGATGGCYMVYVQDRCGSSLSYTSAIDTVCLQTLCNNPVNVLLSQATCHGFTASWTAVSGASSYEVFYTRTTGAGAPTTYSYRSSSNVMTVKSLSTGTTYQVYVKANCASGGQSTTSNTASITTLSIGCKDEIDNSGSLQNGSDAFKIYPNPNTGHFSVVLNTEDAVSPVLLTITDVTGRQIYVQQIGNGTGTIQYDISLQNTLAPGLYNVTVQQNRVRYNQRVIITQ